MENFILSEMRGKKERRSEGILFFWLYDSAKAEYQKPEPFLLFREANHPLFLFRHNMKRRIITPAAAAIKDGTQSCSAPSPNFKPPFPIKR